LGDSDTPIIVEEVMTKKNCKELMLHHNKIASLGASILSNSLNNNYELDLLELWDNRVSDMGVNALVKPLSLNSSNLKGLGLGQNDIKMRVQKLWLICSKQIEH
jgi:Ran GTPase-activating protein (RanGAP) involved in mRNA processing and transport